MQTSVLLSIKPEYAERIFSGIKRYEFRRKVFKNQGVTKVIVYASAPVSRVVGEFEIESILQLNTEGLWHKTKEYSGIEKEYFDKYFCGLEVGYAIKIGKTKLYEVPLKLNESFNISHAPQSFMYIRVPWHQIQVPILI